MAYHYTNGAEQSSSMTESHSWQPLPSQYLPLPPTSIHFDPLQPLLWTGSPLGTLSSHFASPSQGLAGRYTSYRAHSHAVTEMALDQTGIISVGGGIPGQPTARGARGGSVKMANRRGLCLWEVQTEPASPLSTFAFTPSRSSEIIATGVGSELYVINVHRGSTVRRQPAPTPILHLRRSNQLVGSTLSGSVTLLDTRTAEFSVSESVLSHTGGISQIEAEGSYIVTAGYTMRQGHPLPDSMLKIYDSRFLRPLSPIPFPTPPAFVRFHPRISGTVVVASAEGRVQILDLKEVSKGSTFHIDTPSYLTSMAIAPTGEGLAFGDADGYVHLWSSQDDAAFCRFEGEVELPDPLDPLPRIDWREDTPLNLIGMPYYNTPLLSRLPAAVEGKPAGHYHQRAAIDPAILATVKTVDFVGYAAYPASARAAAKRNQVPTKAGAKGQRGALDVPLFRSERERVEAKRKGRKPSEQIAVEEDPAADAKMGKHYRKVEIVYSRFGVEDFDFGFYNKTQYSGLETHITNSYTNSLLQALHYTAPVRTLAEAHTYSSCAKENCLLCEAGFLFRMLTDAKGMNCQATNFSRAFGASPQVSALGLMDHEESTVAYASLIQTFNRFLLEQMTTESDTPDEPLPSLLKPSSAANDGAGRSPLSELLRLEAKTVSVCQQCGVSTSRETGLNVVDLVYPRRALSNEVAPASDFASIVRNSIHRETMARMVCGSCKQTNHLRLKRVLTERALPPVLVLNAGVRTSDELELWMDGRRAPGERFLRSSFTIGRDGDAIVVDQEDSQGGEHTSSKVTYELTSMVVQIQADGDVPHLVALAKVSTPSGPVWHIFNDFLVKPISEEEALSFPGTWKIPAVLFYQRTDAAELLELSSLPSQGDPSILCQDITVSRNRDPSLVKHEVFDPQDLPRRGTLVSIDAEFVSLQQEEAEFHSDGTKKVIRPSRMTLARVSVLRGEGEKTGIPFIDDHIHTSEPVVDYLTEFSGIRAGDLDPYVSRHTLVPLKVAYKKLRMLVDLGCIFIGHGLNKDFRIINIYIPPSQILDTVNIYHLPERSRKLSLRFLAWAVLNSNIQSDTHDSIEDARTALQLYEEHQRLEAEGTWDDELDEVYSKGKINNFKVPDADPSPRPQHQQQPSSALPTPAQSPAPQQLSGALGIPFVPSQRNSRANSPAIRGGGGGRQYRGAD